jgi:hypothetical protein
MAETARIPVPPGPGRDWARIGSTRPQLMEAIEEQSAAVSREHAADPVILESMRIRVARHHHCER